MIIYAAYDSYNDNDINCDCIYSGSVRLRATAEHFIPSVKPYVSEKNVATAICLPIENHKVTSFEGNSLSNYLQSLKEIGIESSAYKIVKDLHKEDLNDHSWPCKITCNKGNCNSSKENIFEDFTSQNATGIAGEHRSLLMSNRVKQYKPSRMNNGIWSEDFETVLPLCTHQSTSSSSSSHSRIGDIYVYAYVYIHINVYVYIYINTYSYIYTVCM
jgi:hypothetical protein